MVDEHFPTMNLWVNKQTMHYPPNQQVSCSQLCDHEFYYLPHSWENLDVICQISRTHSFLFLTLFANFSSSLNLENLNPIFILFLFVLAWLIQPKFPLEISLDTSHDISSQLKMQNQIPFLELCPNSREWTKITPSDLVPTWLWEPIPDHANYYNIYHKRIRPNTTSWTLENLAQRYNDNIGPLKRISPNPPSWTL